ncbi:hypothetical protein LTS18_004968, partial [Coniosporium uncinatum]
GMGRGVAHRLANKGANIVLVARDVEKLEAAIDYLKGSVEQAKKDNLHQPNSENQSFHYISADVSKPEENERMIKEVTEWNNGTPPDIVWANAGYSRPTLFLDSSVEQLHAQMDINYWAAVYLAQAAMKSWLAPLLKDAPSSAAPATAKLAKDEKGKLLPRHFVITSSVVSIVGLAGYSPYSPPKAALKNLSDCLRSELNLYSGAIAKNGDTIPEVKVSTVIPGTILTPGLENENRTKHPVTLMLENDDPHQTEDEVAAAAISSLESGEYLIATQWLGKAIRVSGLGGSPRNGWGIVDALFGWVTNLVWLFVGPDMEKKVYKWGKTNGVYKKD